MKMQTCLNTGSDMQYAAPQATKTSWAQIWHRGFKGGGSQAQRNIAVHVAVQTGSSEHQRSFGVYTANTGAFDPTGQGLLDEKYWICLNICSGISPCTFKGAICKMSSPKLPSFSSLNTNTLLVFQAPSPGHYMRG